MTSGNPLDGELMIQPASVIQTCTTRAEHFLQHDAECPFGKQMSNFMHEMAELHARDSRTSSRTIRLRFKSLNKFHVQNLRN